MSSRLAQGTGTPRRTQTSEEVRTTYHQRLEDDVTKALNAFRDVVRSCQIEDKASNARADFQSQVEVANLAKAADELLRLVSELKVAVIVQEVRERSQECKMTRATYDSETFQSLNDMSELLGNVTIGLGALEKHYYTSATRWETGSRE